MTTKTKSQTKTTKNTKKSTGSSSTKSSQKSQAKPAQEKVDLKTLLKDSAESSATLTPGSEVEGKVINREASRILVDLSPWGTGVIYASELQQTPQSLKNIAQGNVIQARVLTRENEEGLVELSLKEIGAQKAWNALEEIYKENQETEIEVLDANKGGLLVQAEGIQGFLPASQLGTDNYPRVEDGDSNKILEKLKSLEGQKLRAKIINIDRGNQKIIFSEKAAEKKEVKEKLDQYKVGDVVEGEVTGVVDFGAFVEFDEGLEGLVHISELDWKLIEDPQEVVKAGEKVKAKIIDIKDTQVSLSMKALKENPWETVEEKYQVDNVYEGKVTKINPFGAFVHLDEDIHGLAHISQFGSLKNMKQKLELGETYKFKVTSIKPEDHRMSLELTSQKQPENAETQES